MKVSGLMYWLYAKTDITPIIMSVIIDFTLSNSIKASLTVYFGAARFEALLSTAH